MTFLAKGAPDTHLTKKALNYIIEGESFETFDQYKTGTELKQLRGIPLDTELYLSIKEPYEDELIDNETRVNLARPEIEHFFVKLKLKLTINKEPFVWFNQFITGKQIRELGNIPADHEIFLDIKEPYVDTLVQDDTVIDLARPGKENFFSKEQSVKVLIINGRPRDWAEKTISFEQVVILAFGTYDNSPNKVYTVTFSEGPMSKPEGTMIKGSVVEVKNKMVFNVTATDKS
jgi:hypothetical protein